MARIDRYWDGKLVESKVLRQQSYTIGRDPECDMVLRDPFASRKHLVLEWLDQGHFQLRDLGTPNGTVVNGIREFTCPLNSNASIQVGRELLLFMAYDSMEGTQEVIGSASAQSSEASVPDDLDSTALLAPAALVRLQARVRARQRPHLLLRGSAHTSVFPLENQVTTVGYGPVRASLGPSDNGEEQVLFEVVRHSGGGFVLRNVRSLRAGEDTGEPEKETPLKEGAVLRVGDMALEFHLGLNR